MTDDEPIPDTERMLTSDASGPAALHALVRDLGDDELRVLTRIAERLRGGRDAYGLLCLAGDTRQFRSKEAREELEDALVYLACAWLKTETHLEVNR